MSENTYIELFGRRIEGVPATVIFLGIWLTPFLGGIVVGAILFHS